MLKNPICHRLSRAWSTTSIRPMIISSENKSKKNNHIIRVELPLHIKMSAISAYDNVMATLGGDLGTAEDIVKDFERALQIAQFNLYDVQRRLADAHRMVYDKRQEIAALEALMRCSE